MDKINEVVELYGSGKSLREIGHHFGQSHQWAVRRLKAAGIDRRHWQGSGPQHSQWKGGRLDAGQGYFRVWVAPDDPMAAMRTHQGYVLEHRLVMARKLGRPLRRNETVHHIDGDGSNNRAENLQLRQGKHGKHVVMRCLDCGSHNVAAVPLEK